MQHFVRTCKINVVGVLTFQTSSEAIISIFCFLLITPKSDFLLTGAETITPKGSMNTANFGKKTSLFLEYDYVQQTSSRWWILRVNKWFKKRLCGTHPFQETYEISKNYWNISLLHDQAQEKEIRFLLNIFIDKNHFQKEKYGTT